MKHTSWSSHSFVLGHCLCSCLSVESPPPSGIPAVHPKSQFTRFLMGKAFYRSLRELGGLACLFSPRKQASRKLSFCTCFSSFFPTHSKIITKAEDTSWLLYPPEFRIASGSEWPHGVSNQNVRVWMLKGKTFSLMGVWWFGCTFGLQEP